MEDRELLQEKDYEISIQSSGKSREEVYQNLFKQLRNDIHSHIEGYLVEMHVESMRLVHEEIEKFTKKFYFSFCLWTILVSQQQQVFRVRVVEILKEMDN